MFVGAENIIKAAKHGGTVKRVVLTSSIAAMHNSRDNSPPEDISPPVNGSLYTTEDWNNDADLRRSPYPASKVTLARAKIANEIYTSMLEYDIQFCGNLIPASSNFYHGNKRFDMVFGSEIEKII